jgi:hypothetical protein
VAPVVRAFEGRPPVPVYFDQPGPPLLLAVLAIAWLPAVPFLARDVWRLLEPMLDVRARRLQVPFALAASLVALATTLLVRQHALTLFGGLWPMAPRAIGF